MILDTLGMLQLEMRRKVGGNKHEHILSSEKLLKHGRGCNGGGGQLNPRLNICY